MTATGQGVLLVDSGGANIGSVLYALERLGARARLSADPDEIVTAERVILPGVGAAGPAMALLRERGLIEVIRGLKQPLLGICLGMQLLFESSDEGDVECLGLIPGRVRALRAAPGIRVPHMGWNAVEVLAEHPVLSGIPSGTYFYFVHSYHAVPGEAGITACRAEYGFPFTAAVGKGNRFAVQFHPEKSQSAGLRLLGNFGRLCAAAA